MFVRSRTSGNLLGSVGFITAVSAIACCTYEYLKVGRPLRTGTSPSDHHCLSFAICSALRGACGRPRR